MRRERISHDDFLRLLLQSERDIQRYILSIVPQMADAQEIFQETAVALWKEIDQYDPSLPFAPWACRFAANKAKEFLRKHHRWHGYLDEQIATQLLARREQRKQDFDRRLSPLRDCLDELTGWKRTVIHDYYFSRRSIEEISRLRGRSAESLYKTLQRTRTVLMDCVNAKLASGEYAS